jgi:hypothetical protein
MFIGSTARFTSVLVSVLVFMATAGLPEAGEVMLRNKDGKGFSASLIACEGDKLTVLRGADKKQFVLSLAQLDDLSRAEVEAWLAAGGGLSERFEIEVRSGKRQRNTDEDYSDEKNVELEPLVAVKNPMQNKRTRAAKVTALLLGRPVNDRNSYYVFSIETFNLPSLEGGKEGACQMKPVSRAFDDKGTYKFGARYLGWVVLIHDPDDGRIIFSQSLPAPLAGKFGGKFLKLESGHAYDDNLRLIKNFSVYSD